MRLQRHGPLLSRLGHDTEGTESYYASRINVLREDAGDLVNSCSVILTGPDAASSQRLFLLPTQLRKTLVQRRFGKKVRGKIRVKLAAVIENLRRAPLIPLAGYLLWHRDPIDSLKVRIQRHFLDFHAHLPVINHRHTAHWKMSRAIHRHAQRLLV